MEDQPQPAGDSEPLPLAEPAGDIAPPLPPAPAEEDSADTEPDFPEAAAPAAGGEQDPLALVADEATRHRLSPADEERATALLKETLLQGREGVGRAIEHLPKLPWLVGVNGVSAAWEEMKPTFRTRLLAGLARSDSEAARRVRLSLARGLFKIDVPAALKIAVSVAKDLREKETGAVSNRNAQIFASVFIGRAKPWVIQLPIAELKPNEADLVLHVALLAAFILPHPPASQLSILKWGDAAGRLDKISPAAIEAIKRGLGRWSGKWRHALQSEVKGLPEEISALLTPAAHPSEKPEAPASEEAAATAEPPDEAPGESEEEERDRGAMREPREEDDEDEEDEDEDEDTGTPAEPVAAAPRPRPVYESKTMPNPNRRGGEGRDPRESREGREPRENRDPREGRGPRDFNLTEALRQIEQYAQSLRAEAQSAQNKIRQKEEEARRSRQAPPRATGAAPIIAGEPTPEELARLNVQLEARNAELQARLDELREDAEARAASAEAVPSEPAAAPAAIHLPSLLKLKLQEDFDDFMALESEAPDVVVQQHYRALLRHVFEVLRQEGVPLAETKAPAV